MRLAAAGLGLLLAATGAPAEEARAQLEQRIRLAARLLGDAPTVQRITASGNAQALSHLDTGRLQQALAEEALARGELDTARRAVDDVLRHMGRARRLVPDAPALQAAARRRHELMRVHLERLVDAWRNRSGYGGRPIEDSEAIDGDMAAALGLMSTARYFADAGQHEDAVHTLAAAEPHVLSGMKRLLAGSELDYTARAGSPAEEYVLELQRHHALVDLVPLAVNEFRPRGESLLRVQRHGEAGRALLAQAEASLQGGETSQALAQIRSATLQVQRALQAAGLSLPTPTGSPP
jgi:hypothetical protein